mmetsp:Transcript_15521/g.29280  ORF Transcript_15521/g.29280 Transcript_15521/m.29280 type:complete len:687 (+) Transcript_15521:87-2147(+)
MSADNTPNRDHASETTNKGTQGTSSSSIPLVKLNMNNITYRPLMKDFSAAASSFKLSIRSKKKRDDVEMKPLLRKIVLKNITPPSIQPYRLSAWMGPSGSGKTSLLSIAAGMTDYDPEAFGEDSRITINDDKHNLLSKKGSFPKGLSGIVWQDDLLLSNLTVRETVEFAATLKTPRSEIHRIHSMVDQVLEDLGLTSVQYSMIGQSLGGPGRGISGGERKRVSVAQELVTRPPLIFLDEPTSGLDSSAALELMKILKKLCLQGGHSIVTVIHQPRTTIFDLMDDLLLLSRGEEVYSGPAVGARQVLESCPIIGFQLPEQTNIADWIMDLIIIDENRSKNNHSAKDVVVDEEDPLVSSSNRLLPQHWSKINCPDSSSESSEKKRHQLDYRLSSLAEIKNSIPKYTASFTIQLRLLTRRAIKQTRGEKISNASIIAMVAFIVFESAFWFRLENDTDQIYKRNSLVFFMIIAQANGVVISSVPTFRRDRELLTRERAKKMYRVLPYFLAKTLADMSTTIILPVIHVMVVYWTTNMRPSARSYFLFSFLFYLTLTAAQSIGLLMSAALPSLQLALVITPVLVIFLFIVGGFYIPFANMPAWISWVKWFSFATYGYCGLLVTEYDGRLIPCADQVTFQIGDATLCPLPGKEVLNSLGITGLLSNAWFSVIMLIVLQIFCRVTAYLLLRRSP